MGFFKISIVLFVAVMVHFAESQSDTLDTFTNQYPLFYPIKVFQEKEFYSFSRDISL